MNDLYRTLSQRCGAEPDRKGECWIPCPECGREDEKCSFSERGWHCFVCGAGGALQELAKLLDVQKFEPFRMPPKRKPTPRKRTYLWQENTNALLLSLLSHPKRIEFWQAYRPFTTRTIDFWRLGVGTLPACRCKHRRLIYPAFKDRKIIAFRGRAVECECAKWLQSAGSQVVLWGESLLTEGQVVIVCESPVDAMLAMQQTPDVVAIASTGGAGMWRPSWTERLKTAEPEHVVVWFDNDLAGTPTSEALRELGRRWMQEHPKARKLPRAHGPWLANLLLKAHLPTALYHWPQGTPHKMDLSMAYMER